jgi:thymidylate synthase ThyX
MQGAIRVCDVRSNRGQAREPLLPDRRIYLLSPRKLSPETIAVAFAKTSRSPETFDQIAAGLTDDKSARFHEKWVVGYGHASVAEHAVLHVAFENVSRLAIETIESNRLASYTEKSTRYQKWEPDAFHTPEELRGHPLQDDYIRTCRLLFETYRSSLSPVRDLVVKRTPSRDGESAEAVDRRVRSQYVDACRFLLPAAALANVGMTANARVLERAISKLLSHDLQEVRDIGLQLKEIAQAEVPTLVKYAEAIPYDQEASRALGNLRPAAPRTGIPDDQRSSNCVLIDYDSEAENRVLAAAIYRFGALPYSACLRYVQALLADQRRGLAAQVLGRLGPHDVPLRELEYCSYTFDLLMDQGAYAEFKRHRMMTQTPQSLTTQLGYSTPRLVVEAGLESEYSAAMEAASGMYRRLADLSPRVAQYIVPNGFHRRVLARFNLREAYAFCELRTAPNAHFSIRRVAAGVAEEIRRVHPLLAEYMRLGGETAVEVQRQHFTDPPLSGAD